jgi:hypothetical protein
VQGGKLPAQAKLMRILAKGRMMEMAPVAVAEHGGDNDDEDGNEDEECPDGYDYCVSLVCDGNPCSNFFPIFGQ